MQIDKLTYERNVNLGNYQSEKLSAFAQLEPDENPEEAFNKLKRFVLMQLSVIEQLAIDSDDSDDTSNLPDGF